MCLNTGLRALGVRRPHSHLGMIAIGAHTVGNYTGELLPSRCRSQRRNYEKTKTQTLHSRCSLMGRRKRTFVRPTVYWDYSPGVMRCAVVVPAFMIHTPPALLSLGNPRVAVVAPGTAIVMCVRVWSASAPIT
jgi:hypothetical protein